MTRALTYLECADFEALAAALLQPDPAVDRCSLHLCAEASDFLRFNQGALRQGTSVQLAYVTVAGSPTPARLRQKVALTPR